MKTIGKPGGSFETIEEYPVVQQYSVKFGRPPRVETATKRPAFLKENAPIRALLLKKLKGQGV